MRIQHLTIENFKGIETLEIDLSGKDTTIKGYNESGKTTIADSIYWVLFNKDSLGATKFDIKPIKNNETKHGIEPTVEIIFDNITLKKSYSEVWTKPRGSAQKVFTGHTNNFWIDGVPVNANKFASKIKELCDEEKFRLITNPLYFNQDMKWEKRREKLFEICGNVTDQDVINSNKELAGLPEILSGKSCDDYKKIIKQQIKKINEELKKIPVQINEANGFIKTTERPKEDIEKEIDKLIIDRERITKEINVIESGGERALLNREIENIKGQIQTFFNEIENKKNKLKQEKEQKLAKLRMELSLINTDIIEFESKLKDCDAKTKAKEIQLKAMRENWCKANEKEFVSNKDPICSFCGALIPENKLKEVEAEETKKFNLEKAETLKTITEDGKKLSDEIKALQVTIAALDDSLLKAEENKKHKIPCIKDVETTEIKVETPGKLNMLLNKQRDLERELNSPDEKHSEKLDALHVDIGDIDDNISKLKEDLLVFKNNEEYKNRIEELETNERKYSVESETLNKNLFLVEEFIRTKVFMLDEKINSKFEITKFKLFEEQVNGGISECCEATHKDIPWGSMNNAARYNVGLDIGNTFEKYFNLELFRIIDNAESINDFHKTKSQLIKLVVIPKENKADETIIEL